MKESITTTKLRVVFNASTKSSSGVSLNDILMVGPRIQQELFLILMKFKTFPIVITADIMMFRQMLINETDRDFQRVFWRNDASDPIQEYILVTVTYGTTPAPFLATRTLHQLAEDEGDNFPLSSKVIIRDFYVDDLLSDAQSIEKCVIRVGGRIKNTNIPETRHPVLLPSKNHITNLIITYYHRLHLHANQELLLNVLRMQFWLLAGRSVVCNIMHRSVTCVRTKSRTASQLIGNLPAPRIQPSRPFIVTGLVYADFYLFKLRGGRDVRSSKCYVAIFVCFSTNAVYLELISDLSTPTFIAALKRFIARRGKPVKIISDCASNFKRASKELKKVYKNVSLIDKSIGSFHHQ
ncbi:uncharacterized protein LOC111612765 [Centruroides sculpturatus]|uniref:uncharacterized protein LOC111612765 n=1 Tax=Centruroides sculpturatus TaxID=218467 RepID=UPI000C6CBDA1|nr:uncharacterized protein LOC111612765 [Centruroides sculpturatus]